MIAGEDLPLPEDPALAALAVALEKTGQWAEIVDARWRHVYATREFRLSMGGSVELVPAPSGTFYFGPQASEVRSRWRTGPLTIEFMRAPFLEVGGMVLADLPGGRDELRALVDPGLADLVDQVEPVVDVVAVGYRGSGVGLRGSETEVSMVAQRIHDSSGRHAGTAVLMKPAVGMAILANLASHADPAHLARMQSLARAARRPAAILFADLEGSSPLARSLPTSEYFALGRRLVRAADRCVVDAGGVVGRHVGDGVTALFVAETFGSESAAARACIEAARELRAAAATLGDLALRFGLHWGATLYVGQVLTAGRAEVTALGDEMNEAARIEACASGGRTLASKALLERLDAEDAAALGLGTAAYTVLGDLPTATDKARRDAPAVAVCEV